MPPRPRVEPTDDWHQIALLMREPGQRSYELVRPIVRFGQTAAERAYVTGISARTLARKAGHFDAEGMASLLPGDMRSPAVRRRLPTNIRHCILTRNAEYPAFRPHEIAEICRRRDDGRVSHKTIQRILAEESLPTLPKRRHPPSAQITTPAQRRLAIVHRSFDGWNIKSIAGSLVTTRTRVYETLPRFFTEGFAGMPDKSRAPRHHAHQADLWAMAAIRRLPANADLREFRVHTKLRQMGIPSARARAGGSRSPARHAAARRAGCSGEACPHL